MVYFIPKKGARLGNWLFQYAVAASLGDGRVATLDTEYARIAVDRYADFLHNCELVQHFPKGAFVFKEDRSKYKPLVGGIGGRPLVLDGYFQQTEYLQRENFVDQFAVPQRKLAYYHSRYEEWLRRPHVTSIHVRRGDYLRLSHCHPFVGEEYFVRCLSQLPEVNDYMVFSDDIEWCKSFFPRKFPEKNLWFVEGTNLLDDFHLQRLCQNNIISNSSFSWWAAYLNENPGKRILAPDNWFGFFLKMQGIDGKGMYYPGIEKIPVHYPMVCKVKAVWDMVRELPLNLAAAAYHVFVQR